MREIHHFGSDTSDADVSRFGLCSLRAPRSRSPSLARSSAAFLTQTIQLNDAIVKFEIWDTAGQERYHSLGTHDDTRSTQRTTRASAIRPAAGLTILPVCDCFHLAPMYYRGAAAAVVVYDITNRVSERRATAEAS